MAMNFFSASLHPSPSSSSSPSPSPSPSPFASHFLVTLPKQKHPLQQFYPSPPKTRVRSERSESGVTENDPSPSFTGSLSSTRSQLDLLEQLTSTSSTTIGYDSDGGSGKLTIRDQLTRLVGDRDDEFTIPLGKNLKKVSPKFLTISQKRNIRRQEYLNEVSQRNDSVFFATIGAFVILPPLVILGIAILTGYVQLFP